MCFIRKSASLSVYPHLTHKASARAEPINLNVISLTHFLISFLFTPYEVIQYLFRISLNSFSLFLLLLFQSCPFFVLSFTSTSSSFTVLLFPIPFCLLYIQWYYFLFYISNRLTLSLINFIVLFSSFIYGFLISIHSALAGRTSFFLFLLVFIMAFINSFIMFRET